MLVKQNLDQPSFRVVICAPRRFRAFFWLESRLRNPEPSKGSTYWRLTSLRHVR